MYLSGLHESDILFIGINPGAGHHNYHKKRVKRLSPLKKFEYVGQKYYLATQTKKLFTTIRLEKTFATSVKINHFPFATKDENDLKKLLEKYDQDYKLYYWSRLFVEETLKIVKPKLIVCEGKSAFDRLKSILKTEALEYNDDTYVLKTADFLVVGYRRYFSHIKNKKEFASKIKTYLKAENNIY